MHHVWASVFVKSEQNNTANLNPVMQMNLFMYLYVFNFTDCANTYKFKANVRIFIMKCNRSVLNLHP